MKITLTYNIEDANGKVLFKFPANTVLDKITDVWPLIMNYYENFYPIMIGGQCGKYRELTTKEFKTDKFIKLFSDMYRENRIFMNCPLDTSKCISVERQRLYYSINHIYVTTKNILYFRDSFNKVCIEEGIYTYSADIPSIMILSDMIFD